MGADQCVKRAQESGTAADLIGQRGDGEIDRLARIALGLAIERLVLPVLLEQDHGEQARSGKAARQHVEWCRRLADLLASTAGELLANVLHHLPLPRHHLQRLGHALAKLGKLRRAAAGAGGRAGDDDARCLGARARRFGTRVRRFRTRQRQPALARTNELFHPLMSLGSKSPAFMPMPETHLAAFVYDYNCAMIKNIAISLRPVDAMCVAATANQFLPANIPVVPT